MLERAIVEYLRGVPALAALVGDRISPQVVAQQTPLPALTYERPGTDHDEIATGSSGLAAAIVRLTAWAETTLEARAVSEAVRLAMQGQRHTTWGEVSIGGVEFITGDGDGIDLDTGWRFVACDYEVWFYEPKE